MKVGEQVRVTKPSSPHFGVIAKVMAVAPSGWAMVDDGRRVFRVEDGDCTSVVRGNGHVAGKTKE